MKPCHKNRKLIAWLAVDELDGNQKASLRLHLETCAGCRAHFEELSRIAGVLNEPMLVSNIETSERFHRKVVRSLREPDQGPGVEWLWLQCRYLFLNWRAAACGMVILGLLAVLALLRSPVTPKTLPPRQEVVVAQAVKSEFEPSISNYKAVANQSLDRLDELLSEQGSRSLNAAPIYTASAVPLAGVRE